MTLKETLPFQTSKVYLVLQYHNCTYFKSSIYKKIKYCLFQAVFMHITSCITEVQLKHHHGFLKIQLAPPHF